MTNNPHALREMAPRFLRHCTLVFVLTSLMWSAGCSQTVHLRSQTPAAEILLDGESLGKLDDSGVDVEIGAGAFAVPYSLSKGGKVFEGEILRTEISWPTLILGVGLAAIMIPTCATASCLAANPFVLPALALGVVAGTGFGGFVASVSALSWVTLPCFATGFSLGSAPLLLLPISKKTPELVVLGPPWRPGRKKHAPRDVDAHDVDAAGDGNVETNEDEDEDADAHQTETSSAYDELGSMAW